MRYEGYTWQISSMLSRQALSTWDWFRQAEGRCGGGCDYTGPGIIQKIRRGVYKMNTSLNSLVTRPSDSSFSPILQFWCSASWLSAQHDTSSTWDSAPVITLLTHYYHHKSSSGKGWHRFWSVNSVLCFSDCEISSSSSAGAGSLDRAD